MEAQKEEEQTKPMFKMSYEAQTLILTQEPWHRTEPALARPKNQQMFGRPWLFNLQLSFKYHIT